jgi:ferric-dicitrate binding protein FerR (iron transport regulator)
LLEFELVELRERISGRERVTSELTEERDEWRGQAMRHEEAARELGTVVQQAKQLAQTLPATTGGDARQSPRRRPINHGGVSKRVYAGNRPR